ncbi:MAG TPA: hypothetical protein VGD69_16050 [Herpetosiphonaceae bacterium]
MLKHFSEAKLFRLIGKVGQVGILVVLLTSCTGRGGGWLSPNQLLGFQEQATLGFSFRCERSSQSGNTNPRTGQLHIELQYSDHGLNPLGGAFSIHGEADTLDPVLESAICIGQEPPPGGKELIFLGTYRPTSSRPGQFYAPCTHAVPQCRFEVIVRDNDGDLAPSQGDFFSIKLSNSPLVSSQLPAASIIYARAGLLGGGNIKVE